MLKSFSSLLTLLFVGLIASAQHEDFLFREISPPEGFTYGSIKTICEDANGFIWFGTQNGLFKYVGGKVEKFTFQTDNPNSIPSNKISKIHKDRNGILWVATNDGICIFDERKQNFTIPLFTEANGNRRKYTYFDLIENTLGELFTLRSNHISRIDLKDSTIQNIGIQLTDKEDTPKYITFDKSDNLWVGTQKGYIYRSSAPYQDFHLISHHRTDLILTIYPDNNTFWIGYDNSGADHVDQQGSLIEHYNEKRDQNHKLPGNGVRTIIKDRDSRIWMGTSQGIVVIAGNSMQVIRRASYNNLPGNSIYSLFEDSREGIWIGMFDGGIAFHNPHDNHLLHFTRNQSDNLLPTNKISSFAEDKNGMIWVSAEDGSLKKFNPAKNKYISFDVTNQTIIPNNIKYICSGSDHRLWVGTYEQGLWQFDLILEKFRHLPILKDETQNIYAILQEGDHLWIGTGGNGLYLYHLKSGQLHHFERNITDPTSLSSNWVRTLLLDRSGGLWVGTSTGLNYKPKGSDKFKRFFYNQTGNQSLSSNEIFHLFEDSSGQIWIGTQGGGVNVYNTVNANITVLRAKDGLAGNSVFGILQDDKGNMWFSTENGISCYSTQNKTFKNYTLEDGLQGNLFRPTAVFKSSNGELYFGGPNGFNVINPEKLAENPYPPKVLITGLEINYKKIEPNQPGNPIKSSVQTLGKMKLKHFQNSLSFEFASNNYIQFKKNKFQYRLVNYQDDWIESGNEGKATFTKIPPGKYILEVIASNNDGVWSTEPTRLQIEILFPIWRSKLAYLLYFLILISLIWIVRREILARRQLRNQLLTEKVQRENEEKLHQMKLQIFTNISHEFRTPLALILSPLELILNKTYFDNDTKEQLSMIQRNAQRLSRLINQIIDFRKFDLNKIVSSSVKTDIVSICTGVCNYFHLQAKDQHILFEMNSAFSSLEVELDAEKLDKILFNLLSNAFKYTPEGGEIRLSIETTTFEKGSFNGHSTNFDISGEVLAIHITNSGEQIPDEEMPRIFDRFYKASPQTISGTGIGLHICSEYAKLLGGAVTVENLSEYGVIFTLILPQKIENQQADNKQKIVKTWDDLHNSSSESDEIKSELNKEPAYSVLIIEDNNDMQKQIRHLLMNDYKIITASNGKQGLEIAREIFPNIIISDVVMAGMDGFEVCKTIKQDIQTSHIPVILLTSLSGTDKQIDGLETGADAYITKPFENKVLKAQISNLIESRKHLQKIFRESEEKWANDTNLTQRDKNLVERSTQIVEKHLLDANFSVEQLADELGVSRSSLHRKMRVLTNQSATEFIRYVRMKKALKLMKESDLNIDEIGFAVGFNSHSYFTQSFKKLYGKTPTDYQAELRMKEKKK